MFFNYILKEYVLRNLSYILGNLKKRAVNIDLSEQDKESYERLVSIFSQFEEQWNMKLIYKDFNLMEDKNIDIFNIIDVLRILDNEMNETISYSTFKLLSRLILHFKNN